jgi:hypothetical protein
MNKVFLALLLCSSLFSNGQATEKHYSYFDNFEKQCKCDAEYALKDSVKLIHIKKQFYKSKTGHLYEKTQGTKDGSNYVTYFNGNISQEIDPLSFIELDGWFAKDKKNVYYFRPVSGGMQISKLKNADTKTFKILKGEYRYAIDKNHLFSETDIVEDIDVKKIKFHRDKKGKIIKVTSGKAEYLLE